MSWKSFLTSTHLLEAGGWLTITVWAIYKKEIQDGFKSLAASSWSKLRAYFIRVLQPAPASRISDTQIAQVVKSGMGGLTSYLYLLLAEYAADRVTLTEYEESADGTVLATCLVEARVADMKSVQSDLQGYPLPAGLWPEIMRIHNQFLRAHYVKDARLEDNAVLRDALIESGVWSAYYHTIPDDKGKCRALLALSWHDEHKLTKAQRDALHLSGRACETILLLMVPLKPTSK